MTEYKLLVACYKGELVEVQKLLPQVRNAAAIRDSWWWEGKTLLHYSCHHGWLDMTRKLVEQYHCDPECRDKDGDTPLHMACRKGHLAMAKALTNGQDCKAARNLQNNNGDTPLHLACYGRHVDIVRYLVSECGCSTACQNKVGDTPLHVACREGLPMVIALTCGQDCKAVLVHKCRDRNGDTPLHLACYGRHVDIVRYLVSECGCSTACQNKVGDTPLHVACCKGHVDIVRYLVSELGCSTVCQNKVGDTPLHVACREGHLAMVKALTSGQDYKVACNCQNRMGDTPLHMACRKGHVDIVRYLVSEQGCSTTLQNKDGDTPLHIACREGYFAIVEVLTSRQDCKAVCKCQNRNGDNPLHEACRKGHVNIVRHLVSEQGCSTIATLQNKDGDTPLCITCYFGYVDLVRYLVSEQGCSTTLQNMDGNTLLHKACREGRLPMVIALTSGQDCKAACNLQNNNGDTPLHLACYGRHVGIVRYLVSEQGCSTTLQNMDGNTLLHKACREGRLPMAKALTSGQDYKAACNLQNNNGDTPLHLACYGRHVDIVRYLVSEQGCSTTLQNMDGNTLLHKACREGCLPMAKALTSGQDCKAACNLQNNNGDTPLHLACYGRYVDIVRYLVIEKGCSTACQNKVGDTPLHVACRGHLAICMVKALTSGQDYKVACNCQNRMGDTPLHMACRKGHVDIVRYLVIEQKCSTACQNKDGNTPLHEACRWNQLTDVVKILLSTGRVDPWCKNASNQTPVQLTNSYVISKLFAELAKDLKTAIKVFIFGNPAAGKSTLVKVIENKVTSRFRALAGQFRNVSGVELKTAGINTVTIQNSRLGTVTIYDLAGQFEYYASHDALVENLISSSVAVFIVVVKLSESEAEVIQTLRYWISFIENCCSRVEGTAHLMVVGSWADKVKEAGENIDQKWLNIKKACISSSSPLHFVGFTSLDCRKLASSGLDQICDMIGSSCTALREAAEQESIIYPHLLHAFIQTNFSTEICCSIKELCTYITAEDDAFLPIEPNLLSPLLSSLSDGGHLLYLPNKEDFEAGWVVINKQAVLSEIDGTIFAPEYFKQHHDIATSTGVVPKSKIVGVFAEMYNIDMILCVLTAFEFCQKIKDSFTLSLIASSDPSRMVLQP